MTKKRRSGHCEPSLPRGDALVDPPLHDTSHFSMTTQIAVLAHNEERRIALCLDSLPLGEPGIAVAVVVNGSSDATSEIVRGYADRGVRLVEYAQGGKARSWNRFMLDEAPEAASYVFVDGDAQLLPGTVQGLVRCLRDNPRANAAAGMPRNGRRAAHYRQLLAEEHGLFGDCYTLSGGFVARLRAGAELAGAADGQLFGAPFPAPDHQRVDAERGAGCASAADGRALSRMAAPAAAAAQPAVV
jgi:hypothetical protein